MTPLIVTEASLAVHFGKVGEIVAKYIDASATPSVAPDWLTDPLAAGIVGPGCELVQRNRGSSAIVAPIAPLGAGMWSWLGYREEWASEAPAGKTKRFSFRASGITIHFGQRNSQLKPQIFRSEWAGFAKWDGKNYGYQAGDAGHPHWQFDALESLGRDEVADRAATYLAVLKHEEEEFKVQDFAPALLGGDETLDIVATKELSRLHFASAAAWWKVDPHNLHAHAPAKELDLQKWLDSTLAYTVLELERLR